MTTPTKEQVKEAVEYLSNLASVKRGQTLLDRDIQTILTALQAETERLDYVQKLLVNGYGIYENAITKEMCIEDTDGFVVSNNKDFRSTIDSLRNQNKNKKD